MAGAFLRDPPGWWKGELNKSDPSPLILRWQPCQGLAQVVQFRRHGKICVVKDEDDPEPALLRHWYSWHLGDAIELIHQRIQFFLLFGAAAAACEVATNRQVDWGAQRRSCTSVAELPRESSCHSQDSGRGVD